jgi:probable F420-dependent oxidoreductase
MTEHTRTAQLSVGLSTRSAEDPGSWDRLLAHAEAFDRAGFDRLVIPDHVVFGEQIEEYGRPEIGGRAGGRLPYGPDGHFLEPLATLAVLAGLTSRIRLGTRIFLAALRRPVVLAKSLATLDVLSGGRLDLGVGVGWQRQEYEAAGLDFDARGRQLDHTLEVCQVLWRDVRAEYRSPELEFEAIHMMPKPLQPDGIPLWVSGRVNPPVVRRLIRFGSGWIPWGDDASTAGIARMRDALAAAGRDLSDFQVVGMLPIETRSDGTIDIDRTMTAVPGLLEAGVTDLSLSPQSPFTAPTTVGSFLPVPEDRNEAIDYLSPVVSAFRIAAGA